jgi:protein TonB
MINRAGKLINTAALTTQGYGMEEEAIRVFKRSPKWKPAIYPGEPIDSWYIQPVIFVIKESNKKR